VTGYAEAVRALTDRGRFGIRLGLGRARALLRELGDPHLASRGALVAGTNGKGSVIALAGSALRAAGHHVAETPKPHLVTYRERMVIDGRPIDPETFSRLVEEVLPIAERIERRHGAPTEFELLTAMLFRWFAEERVEVALVEVGLGGRLDATNVWDGGVAVVTNVDLDHTDRLGTTIPAIAREKAAIIKRGDVAVTGATGDGLAVVRRRASRLGVPLRIAEPAPIRHQGRDGLVVDLPGMAGVTVALRGRHQAANVAVADAVLDALADAGLPSADHAARRAGYAAARWPGRLELLTLDGRDVLLDGAHNPAGAATLAQAIADLRAELTPGPLTLIWATMADKDVDAVIAAMTAGKTLDGSSVVATQVDAPRALPAPDLAARWRGRLTHGRVVTEPDPVTAIERARRDAVGPIVIAGSLYLVGTARAHLLDDPLLRDPTG
jgi:dihydrofolate synthase / folylpolyglutamate synthase